MIFRRKIKASATRKGSGDLPLQAELGTIIQCLLSSKSGILIRITFVKSQRKQKIHALVIIRGDSGDSSDKYLHHRILSDIPLENSGDKNGDR